MYRLVSIWYSATSKNIPEHSIPTCTLSADIAKCMTHLTLIPLKLTAYRITNLPCCYLFGHILGIYQRNDYGKQFESANIAMDTKTWYLTQLTWNEYVTHLVTHLHSTLSFRWKVHFSFCSLPCAHVHLWSGVQRNLRRDGQSNDQVREKSQLTEIFYNLTNKNSQITLNNCWFYQSIRCWSDTLMAVGL